MTLRHVAGATPTADEPTGPATGQRVTDGSMTDQPAADTHRSGRLGSVRAWLAELPSRLIGECWAASPGVAAVILVVVAALLVVIGCTLSPGNALLVVVAGVIMRLSCEHRPVREPEP